jgi:hypothetical protein
MPRCPSKIWKISLEHLNMRFKTLVILYLSALCVALIATAVLFPGHRAKTIATPTSVPTLQIDLSGSLDCRKFGFSGHPGQTHIEFIGHRMITVLLPGATSATFEVGIWQFFQMDGKMLSINLYSPGTDLEGAYKLASRYTDEWNLPGQKKLDAWKEYWNTPQGKLKLEKTGVTNSDNLIGETGIRADGWRFMVVIRQNGGNPKDHDGWLVIWSAGPDSELWHQ